MDLAEQIEQKNEQFRKVVEDVESLLTSDDLSEEEKAEFEEKKEKRDRLYSELKELKKTKEQRKELEKGGNEPIKPTDEEFEKEAEASEKRQSEHYHEAYSRWLRHGERELQREDIDLLREVRDLSTNVDDKGGFLVPQQMGDSITEARKQFNGIRQADVTVIQTESGGPIELPTNDDTSNKGEILGEGNTVSNQDISVGTVTLESYTFSSKDVNVSNQLLNDSAFELESFLGRKLGERIGRKASEVFTTGDGSSEPHGVVTASTKGTEAASNGDIVEEDLMDLKHSLDPAYRNNAQWMMHDDVVLNLKKTQDADGNPIFMENYRDGVDRLQIDGDPVIVNQDMQNTLADGNKTVLYGDFRNYWIREVQSVSVRRLDEINARSNQTTFLAFARMDANLLDAGQSPIKHLAQ